MSSQRVCWSDTFSDQGNNYNNYKVLHLERPLLWFVANGYVFCCQMISVTAARLKLGRDIHPSFFSICESLEVILQFDTKVTTAFITGGESWLVANCFKPEIEY